MRTAMPDIPTTLNSAVRASRLRSRSHHEDEGTFDSSVAERAAKSKPVGMRTSDCRAAVASPDLHASNVARRQQSRGGVRLLTRVRKWRVAFGRIMDRFLIYARRLAAWNASANRVSSDGISIEVYARASLHFSSLGCQANNRGG